MKDKNAGEKFTIRVYSEGLECICKCFKAVLFGG